MRFNFSSHCLDRRENSTDESELQFKGEILPAFLIPIQADTIGTIIPKFSFYISTYYAK